MKDIIYGNVISVVDGDTFDLQLTKIDKRNQVQYNKEERIRLAGIDAPEINTEKGKEAKVDLWNKISGKKAKVIIQARDTYGRLIGDCEFYN